MYFNFFKNKKKAAAQLRPLTAFSAAGILPPLGEAPSWGKILACLIQWLYRLGCGFAHGCAKGLPLFEKRTVLAEHRVTCLKS